MLGVALNAQRAGWGTGAPAANFVGISKLGYENRQTPSFSYLVGVNRPSWNVQEDAQANIANAAVTDNKGFAIATTFYMDWNEATVDPQDPNTIYGFLHECVIKTATTSGNRIESFLQLRDGRLNITNRFETSNTIQRITKDLPGTWQDYNQRWLTLIFASSEDPGIYTNYAPVDNNLVPITGNTSGRWNTRSGLYDTETGELIQQLDWCPPTDFAFPGLADWPMQSGDYLPVPFNLNTGDWGIRVQGSINAFLEPAPQPYRLANVWGSLGRGFDPAQYSANVRTTRPSSQIGDAVAWYNIQFADYVTGSGSTPYYIPVVSSTSVMSSNNSRAWDLTDGNNADQFNAGYSNTIIPRDRNI
jgi:hypothetical protein